MDAHSLFLRQSIGGKEGYFQQREEYVWSR